MACYSDVFGDLSKFLNIILYNILGVLLYFKCFRSLESKSIELMSLTVTGACILHNLAIKNNDLIEVDENLTDFETLIEGHDSSASMAVTQRNGISKRNELASR